MQVAIDNAKRRFDVDIMSEIQRIKEDMKVEEHGYPMFWKLIRPDFNLERINNKLICPMNDLRTIKIKKMVFKDSTLPMKDFFIKHKLDINRRKCKRVEEMIEVYGAELLKTRLNTDSDFSDYLLSKKEFDKLIKNIQQIKISKDYLGLMSWLIDRALTITPAMKQNTEIMDSNLYRNRPILLKTLYKVNKNNFLECFTKK